MPRGEKDTAPKHPHSQPVTGDTRARGSTARPGRVKGRSSPKRNVVDWGPAYLKRFAECGVMKKACDDVGVDYHTVWDRRQTDPAFKAAEEVARGKAADLLESIAWDRATNGTAVLKFHQGLPILDPRATQKKGRPVFYEEREFDNGLLVTLLKAHKPQKYRENVEVTGRIEHISLDEAEQRFAEANK